METKMTTTETHAATSYCTDHTADYGWWYVTLYDHGRPVARYTYAVGVAGPQEGDTVNRGKRDAAVKEWRDSGRVVSPFMALREG